MCHTYIIAIATSALQHHAVLLTQPYASPSLPLARHALLCVAAPPSSAYPLKVRLQRSEAAGGL